MPAAVTIRTDYSAGELRRLAGMTKNASQSRRLLSLAAVLDGMNRTEAARIGGMDRQTLRDWVHRFNEHGPDGLKDTWSKGPPPRLSPEQQDELAHLVEAGPDRAVHGVVRWRRVDLQGLIAERYSVADHERTVGKLLHQLGFSPISSRPLLHQLGFSPISSRPRHTAQDERVVTEFKKTSPSR
jgi:transposase